MNAATSLKLFQLTKEFIPDEAKAQEFVAKIEETIDEKFENKTQVLATKHDIFELEIKMEKRLSETTKAIYIVGLVQFIAIVGSVLAIVNFMLK